MAYELFLKIPHLKKEGLKPDNMFSQLAVLQFETVNSIIAQLKRHRPS